MTWVDMCGTWNTYLRLFFSSFLFSPSLLATTITIPFQKQFITGSEGKVSFLFFSSFFLSTLLCQVSWWRRWRWWGWRESSNMIAMWCDVMSPPFSTKLKRLPIKPPVRVQLPNFCAHKTTSKQKRSRQHQQIMMMLTERTRAKFFPIFSLANKTKLHY